MCVGGGGGGYGPFPPLDPSVNANKQPRMAHCGTPCTDPESFVRRGPSKMGFFCVFSADEGREDSSTTISGPSYLYLYFIFIQYFKRVTYLARRPVYHMAL